MRAITVRQPWAALILHSRKNIENRTRNIVGAYRGPIAIHAALTYDDWAMNQVGRFADHPATRHVGAIVGVVDIVGVHRARGLGCGRQCEHWGQDIDGVHIELARPRPLATPIPCRGFLGLWTLPTDVAAALEAVV